MRAPLQLLYTRVEKRAKVALFWLRLAAFNVRWAAMKLPGDRVLRPLIARKLQLADVR